MTKWNDVIRNETQQEYYVNGLAPFLRQEYENYTCFPPKENIFQAFKYIENVEDTRVVILGQDPYPKKGQANGLSFAVNEGIKSPKSLQNIQEELHNEYGIYFTNTTLIPWAKQGVLMLNSVMTVREGIPQSHSCHGWETFTGNIIKTLNNTQTPLVYMLWGKYAKNQKSLINTNNPNILILETTHPSPYSYNFGFKGCKHFLLCNRYFQMKGYPLIDWYRKE